MRCFLGCQATLLALALTACGGSGPEAINGAFGTDKDSTKTCSKPEGCISEQEKQARAAEIERQTVKLPVKPLLITTQGEAPVLNEVILTAVAFPRIHQVYEALSTADLGVPAGEAAFMQLSDVEVEASDCSLSIDDVVLGVAYKYIKDCAACSGVVAGVGQEAMTLESAPSYTPTLSLQTTTSCSVLSVRFAVRAGPAPTVTSIKGKTP